MTLSTLASWAWPHYNSVLADSEGRIYDRNNNLVINGSQSLLPNLAVRDLAPRSNIEGNVKGQMVLYVWRFTEEGRKKLIAAYAAQ